MAFYYSSAKRIENAIVLPQAGAKRREGFKRIGLQRGALSYHDTFSFGAPNGGTANNVNDPFGGATSLETTTGISTTTEYVIATIDTISVERISVVDLAVRVTGLPSGATSCTIALQSSADDVTYTTRATLEVGTSLLLRRFALAPDTDLATARYWRVIIDNAAGANFGSATAQAQGLAMAAEAGWSQSGAAPGAVLLRRITASVADEYFAVISEFSAEIYRASDGAWQASVYVPHLDAEVAEIKTSQNLDTLVLYHREHPPHVLQRLDMTDDRWRSGEFAFDTVAQFPFEDSTTGGQNEIQELLFSSMSASDIFVFEFNGQVSDEISWSGTAATNITNITNALEGLDDITSVTVTNPAGNRYRIEFDGADAKTFFATIVTDITTGSGTVVNSRIQYGRPDQEDLWSDDRGYPRCGTFYQGRHYMGGFKARPDVIVGSRVGAFDDFKEDADPIATSPLVLAPDIDEQVTVENIYPGRNLQIFTSSAELYVPDEPITPDNVALKVSSRRGCQSKAQPVDVQGGTFFVDRNGTNLREYLFAEAEQSYTAEPISTLGGHLVQQPSDMALRLSVDTDEPTILYLVNTGRDRSFDKVPAALCTIDRAQQVTAFARITSGNGEFQAVATSQGGAVAFVVQRELAGNAWNYVELADKRFMSDAAEEIANPDIDSFTATAAQTVFTYTFSNPITVNDIAVFQREDETDKWVRIEQADYTLDTGAKTVTLDTGLDAGTLVSICKRQTSISGISDYLEGVECYLHGDGRPIGAHTPGSNAVTINGDEGFFFEARIGIRMVPRIVLQPYKGKGGRSPTMQRQRIFRALVNLERTSHAAISMEGQTPKAIALTDYDGEIYDQDLEEILFTGVKRVSGLGRWELEPRLEITQTEPGPFVLRSVSYDIRF